MTTVRGPLICDLDGTIADTAAAIFESLRVVCAAMDVPIDDDADLSFALGPPLHHSFDRLGIDGARAPEALARFDVEHTERIGSVAAMPGAVEVLTELGGLGVRIGIATLKPNPIAALVLQTLGLEGSIHAIHGRTDDVDPRTKTDLVRAALDELDGGRPLYVGDHDNDELAAAENGIAFLRYPDASWADIRRAILDTPPASGADGTIGP